MIFNEEQYKLELLDHFLGNNPYNIRINPSFNNEVYKSEELEMIQTMYIMDQIPYLEVYHCNNWNESMIRLIDKIPDKEKADYYRNKLEEFVKYHHNMIDNLEKVLGL